MNIFLIGCGLTGGAIASNLLKLSEVKNLELYSRTIKSSKTLESELKNSKVSVLDKLDSISKFDYIIVALSGMSDSSRDESIATSRSTFEVRQDELKFNIGAIIGLVPYLKNVSDKTKIIIVTNPVDELVNFLRIILSNKNIFGFGLDLDAKRYSKVLGKEVYCIGTHGKAVPLINSSSEKEYDELYKKTDSELMSYIKRNGIPHELAGEAFVEFFSKLISKKEQITHISYYLNKEFLEVKNVSISLPCVVKNGEIIKPVKIFPNDIEKKRFQKSVQQLKKSVNHILITNKKLLSYK